MFKVLCFSFPLVRLQSFFGACNTISWSGCGVGSGLGKLLDILTNLNLYLFRAFKLPLVGPWPSVVCWLSLNSCYNLLGEYNVHIKDVYQL